MVFCQIHKVSLFQLKRPGIKLIVLAFFSNQLLMFAAFDDSALFKDYNTSEFTYEISLLNDLVHAYNNILHLSFHYMHGKKSSTMQTINCGMLFHHSLSCFLLKLVFSLMLIIKSCRLCTENRAIEKIQTVLSTRRRWSTRRLMVQGYLVN
jgi:hypothetical protein